MESSGQGELGLGDPKLLVLGENVDRLLSVDLWSRPHTLPLYYAARDRQAGPLALLAAHKLHQRLDPQSKDVVLFVTGFISPTLLVGEQDGPVGSASLGRMLSYGYNARVVIVTDEDQVHMVEQTCRGAGFNVYEMEAALQAGLVRGKSAAVIDYPKDIERAKSRAVELLNELQPAAIIAIERPSANAKGRYHGVGGQDITDLHAKTDHLVAEARARGILTISVADGGNELGSGLIEDAVAQHRPNGAKCTCPCGGTIAAHSQTEVLVFAAISDWGALGIGACLAAINKNPRMIHSDDVLVSTLREATYIGLEDGMAGWVDPGSDGISWRIETGLLGMLRTLVENYVYGPE